MLKIKNRIPSLAITSILDLIQYNFGIYRKFDLIVLISLLVIFSSSQSLFSQIIPISDIREDQIRLLQLQGDSVSYSMSNRSLWTLPNKIKPEALWGGPLPYTILNNSNLLDIGLYDLEFQNIYNNNLPFGENNESSWYGRGSNLEIKGGFFATSDYVTITFRPLLSYSQNSDFKYPRFIPTDDLGIVLYGAEEVGFSLDSPFRYGPDPFWNFDLGYTSVRFHYKNFETGFSKEPRWWGPGKKYSLIMSNNAPGMKHVFFGSRSPVKLPYIGNLEFTWMGGWPEDSKYYVHSFVRSLDVSTETQRFMNGLNVIYSPSFISNLHVGVSRVFHQYVPEGGLSSSHYLAVFQDILKVKIGNNPGDNQIFSAHFRWLFPESRTELYAEFTREDHSYNARDFILEPNHARAYTIGLQKILPSKLIEFFKLSIEINSLIPGQIAELRPQPYFYTHARIRQGHTNEGKILGAGIGPGSESQFFAADAYLKKGKVGLFAQRVVDNDLFHFRYNREEIDPFPWAGEKDWWRHRVDLHLGLQGAYSFNSFIFSSTFTWTKAFNYGRFDIGDMYGFYEQGGNDETNIQFEFGIQYRF